MVLGGGCGGFSLSLDAFGMLFDDAIDAGTDDPDPIEPLRVGIHRENDIFFVGNRYEDLEAVATIHDSRATDGARDDVGQEMEVGYHLIFLSNVQRVSFENHSSFGPLVGS